MTGTTIRPLVAAALLALAAPAFAEPAYSNAKVTIDASGIDLTSATGRQALDRRVQNAINAICGAPVYGTREEAEDLRTCRSETRATVQPQVQAMLLRANVTVSENR
jgi:UrcA family protein